MHGSGSGRPALEWRIGALHLALMLLLALLIYMPWSRVPFPMLDYSEFLPPLRRSHSFAEALANLSSYYRAHGRTSYLAYAQLAANWSLFGARPMAWNAMVFGYMFSALAAVWLLLVRVGHRPGTASAAASLLIVATPAVPGWLRPSGEPLALLFFCIALLLARSYPRTPRWPLFCLLIVLALLGIALAKDLLAPLALIPVFVACCWDRGFHWPRPTQRNVALLIGAALAAAIIAAIIVSAQLERAPNAYTNAYRLGNVSPEWVITIFLLMVLPVTSAFMFPQMFANVAWLLAGILGWYVRIENDAGGRWLRVAGMLAFVGLGALLYAPVAWFSPLYGLPFFLGTVLIVAGALTRAAQAPLAVRRVVRAAVATVIVIAGGVAFNEARVEMAERRLNGQLAQVVGGAGQIDSVLVALPTVNPWQWAQQSAVLVRYARDRGDLRVAAVGTRDVACASLRLDARPAARTLLISLEKCGALGVPARSVAVRYTQLNPLPASKVMRAQYFVTGGAE